MTSDNQTKSEICLLAIESSCDDTSIAIIKGEAGSILSEVRPKILSMQSFSQEFMLKKWGGVVPEIAAREHVKKFKPLLEAALNEAQVSLKDLDAFAVTTHPGLMGPLLSGINCAKTLALLYQKPMLGINHLYAHLEAIHLTEKIAYPYLGVLVSGGHSHYLLVRGCDQFEILGGTLDDASGEAFDKGGKMLGLPYPAGKYIDERAKLGSKTAHSFPISYQKKDDAHLSFSGVKNALRVHLEKYGHPSTEAALNDLCASYQEAIVEALCHKTKSALAIAKQKLNQTEIKLPIVIGGGVACNSRLREAMKERYRDVFIVAPKYCTDNASMIANLALRMYNKSMIYPLGLDKDALSHFIEKKKDV